MKFSLKLFGGTVVGLLLAGSALAQTFPAKPVTLMVPYPAGGVSDVIARTLNVTLSKHLGQAVIVENLGGGWRHCGAKGNALVEVAQRRSLLSDSVRPVAVSHGDDR